MVKFNALGPQRPDELTCVLLRQPTATSAKRSRWDDFERICISGSKLRRSSFRLSGTVVVKLLNWRLSCSGRSISGGSRLGTSQRMLFSACNTMTGLEMFASYRTFWRGPCFGRVVKFWHRTTCLLRTILHRKVCVPDPQATFHARARQV